ncbi:phage baseplate assembly protein domain-containing protein [Candidatus Vondammii sp. HM_W22]|uniref:phage baseplate assembly protein domain-containing protein n=1 Tax=Candidatus Vondammii sp. HM_W22 TaxID=2687299 RepID=UPI002E7AE08C|nr:phage baseplate assembly protein [Candidatus Vondammii sp. HM_W22]
MRRRLRLLVSRAVGRLVDPSTLLQTLQLELLRGELLDGVEHVEGYGLGTPARRV